MSYLKIPGITKGDKDKKGNAMKVFDFKLLRAYFQISSEWDYIRDLLTLDTWHLKKVSCMDNINNIIIGEIILYCEDFTTDFFQVSSVKCPDRVYRK